MWLSYTLYHAIIIAVRHRFFKSDFCLDMSLGLFLWWGLLDSLMTMGHSRRVYVFSGRGPRGSLRRL